MDWYPSETNNDQYWVYMCVHYTQLKIVCYITLQPGALHLPSYQNESVSITGKV